VSTLLHIDSSPMGENSISRRLTCEYAHKWRAANPDGKVIYRDLAATHFPVIDAAWVAANYAQASRTPRQNDLLALSTELTTELLEADEYVIGAPMHNWGPSAGLKLWTDQLVHFGRTVLITPRGMKGNLQHKRAWFFIAAGRPFHPGSENAARNHLQPWLRTFFSNLGVTDMQFMFVDGTADVQNGKIDQAVFLAPHVKAIQQLFAAAAE